MTGFRVALGGACQLYALDPDLVTLGKIVGGGLPVGVFGGKRQFMDQLAPLGPVYQAGTLSGNPLAMAAGIATIGYLQEHAARCLHAARSKIPRGRRGRCPGSREGRDFRSPPTASAPCGHGSSRAAPSRTTSKPRNPTRLPSAASTARCSSRESGFRLRSLKRHFSPRRTAMPTSQATIAAARALPLPLDRLIRCARTTRPPSQTGGSLRSAPAAVHAAFTLGSRFAATSQMPAVVEHDVRRASMPLKPVDFFHQLFRDPIC